MHAGRRTKAAISYVIIIMYIRHALNREHIANPAIAKGMRAWRQQPINGPATMALMSSGGTSPIIKEYAARGETGVYER